MGQIDHDTREVVFGDDELRAVGRAVDVPGLGEAPTCRPTTPIVTVSAVIGDGPDAHRLARVDNWTFRLDATDPAAEPLIRDLNAAERLGFARPRDIRKLIERIWPETERPIGRATVARSFSGRGNKALHETTVTEFWLTEAQLLKVVTRSETKVADAIVDEMIAVYMAVRRGLIPATAPDSRLSATVAEVVGQVKTLAEGFTHRG